MLELWLQAVTWRGYEGYKRWAKHINIFGASNKSDSCE